MIYNAFIFWLKSAGVLYVLVSTALYLDQEAPLIRKHCRSPRMVALKMVLAPLTIVYIAFRIGIAWPKFLVTHRLAGCFAGNTPPAIPAGLRNRPAGDYTTRCDRCGARVTGHGAQWGYEYACGTRVGPHGELAIKKWQTQACVLASRPVRKAEGPATACSSAVCRNAIVNTQGPNSVVSDIALEEAYNAFPVLSEAHL